MEDFRQLEVARRTFTALLRSGSTVHGFSLVVFGASAVLAAAVLVNGRPAGTLILLLLGLSLLATLPEVYYAVRVRIDAGVFESMARAANGGVELEAGREQGAGEVKAALPGTLGKMGIPNPADPLDAYRRSARLFVHQACWAAVQLLFYGAALFLGGVSIGSK